MTLKTTCKCGANFYISIADESHSKVKLVSEKYDLFMGLHKDCCDVETQELPEDWKV